jgi:hypothetical protein
MSDAEVESVAEFDCIGCGLTHRAPLPGSGSEDFEASVSIWRVGITLLVAGKPTTRGG